MNKSNFVLWCKIAQYASRNESIYIPSNVDKYISKHRGKLASMYLEGYFTRKYHNSNTLKYDPTDKFKQEFKAKYLEQISPDFTETLRQKMLDAFKF